MAVARAADELEVHAAALYTALLRAGELERARDFMAWWTGEKKIARGSTESDDLEPGRSRSRGQVCGDCASNPCMCWDDDDFEGPNDYDADELGIDPEE